MRSKMLKQKFYLFLQTGVLGLALLGLALASGKLLLGSYIFPLLFMAAAFILTFYRISPQGLLRKTRAISYGEAPSLYRITRELVNRAGLDKTPRLYYLPIQALNAATVGGKDEPAIILTQGLLSRLDEQELEGVLAHEISHIRNGDMKIFLFADIIRQMAGFFANIGWFMLILFLPLTLFGGTTISLSGIILLLAAPLLTLLLEFALLRTREFAADLGAVELTGNPLVLAAALKKIEGTNQTLLSYLFPLPRRNETSIFGTHPATKDRVERLNKLAHQQNRF